MGQGPASRKENTGVSTGVVAQAPAVAFRFAGALAEQNVALAWGVCSRPARMLARMLVRMLGRDHPGHR